MRSCGYLTLFLYFLLTTISGLVLRVLTMMKSITVILVILDCERPSWTFNFNQEK